MIKSMTGFAKSEIEEKGIKASAEIKSLNGRYLDVSFRLPRALSSKEYEIRNIIKEKVGRGSINLTVKIERESSEAPLKFNFDAASDIWNDLNELKKVLKSRETVKIDHLMHFSSSFYEKKEEEIDEEEWNVAKKAIIEALTELDDMRFKEGGVLAKDFISRIDRINTTLDNIEGLGVKRIPNERERLRRRVAQLFESEEIDERRLQMEIVLLSDKLDISEECVRLRSHIKFFREAMKDKESPGRKINFLLQEMHREVNTIGSKADDAQISQHVVAIKEEIERIREQVQNVE